MVADEEKLNKKDEEANGIVTLCIDDSLRYFADRQSNLDRYEGVRAKTEAKTKEWGHEYISHIAAEMIEQKTAFMTQAIINPEGKMFDIATYNNIEFARDARAAAELLNYYMSNIPLVETASKIHRDCFLFGDAIVEVYHKTVMRKELPKDESGIRLITDEEGEFGALKANSFEEVVEIKQPYFKIVRLNNFYPDPNALDGSLESCRFIVKRELKTRKDVKRNKKKFGLRNLDRAFSAAIPERFTNVTSDSAKGLGNRKRLAEYDIENIRTYNDKCTDEDGKMGELITIYRPGTQQFMVNGIIVSDEQVVYPGIRYPFVKFPNTPFEGEFFSRADLELVKNNIEFYEEMVNLIHDKYLLNISPKFLADSMMIDSKALKEYKKAGAGDIIAVDGFTSEGIKEVAVAPPDPSSVAFASTFKDDSKKALAINPMMESESPGSGIRTEGSLQMFQRLGSTRIQTQLGILVKCWEEVGRLMLKMAKIFMDEELYLSITGPLGDTIEGTITKKEINPDTRFKIQLGSIADPNKNAKIARMFNYIATCQKSDRLGLYRAEQALAETAEFIGDFHDPMSHWETNPEVIQARIDLAAQIAGNKSPVSNIPSPSEMQKQQQSEQPAMTDEAQMMGQTEAPQTMQEGQPVE